MRRPQVRLQALLLHGAGLDRAAPVPVQAQAVGARELAAARMHPLHAERVRSLRLAVGLQLRPPAPRAQDGLCETQVCRGESARAEPERSCPRPMASATSASVWRSAPSPTPQFGLDSHPPRILAAGTRMGHRRAAWRVRRSCQQVPCALCRRAYGVHRACQRGQGGGSRLLEGHAARGGRPCQVGHRPIATARAACMRRGSYHLAVWCVRTGRRRRRPRTATASGRLRRGRRDACGLRQ